MINPKQDNQTIVSQLMCGCKLDADHRVVIPCDYHRRTKRRECKELNDIFHKSDCYCPKCVKLLRVLGKWINGSKQSQPIVDDDKK